MPIWLRDWRAFLFVLRIHFFCFWQRSLNPGVFAHDRQRPKNENIRWWKQEFSNRVGGRVFANNLYNATSSIHHVFYVILISTFCFLSSIQSFSRDKRTLPFGCVGEGKWTYVYQENCIATATLFCSVVWKWDKRTGEWWHDMLCMNHWLGRMTMNYATPPLLWWALQLNHMNCGKTRRGIGIMGADIPELHYCSLLVIHLTIVRFFRGAKNKRQKRDLE